MSEQTVPTGPPNADIGTEDEPRDQQQRHTSAARHLGNMELPSIKVLQDVVAIHSPDRVHGRQSEAVGAEVNKLPPVLDVVTAGQVLGMGRTKSYALARAGQFPCRIIRAGRSYLVPTAELLRLLGLGPSLPVNADTEDIDHEE